MTARSLWTTAVVTLGLFVSSSLAVAGSWLDKRSGDKTPDAPHVTARLISETDALIPQAQNRLAVVLDHEAGWHTYWQMPGDSGLATTFKVTAPSDVTVTPPRFPVPERLVVPGVTSYAHHDTTLYPFVATPERHVPTGKRVTLTVKVRYLACKDLCIPGETSASITLPFRINAKPTADAQAVDEAFKALPEVRTIEGVTATYDQTLLKIALPDSVARVNHSLAFFPLDARLFALDKDQRFVKTPTEDALFWTLSDNAKLDGKTQLKGVLVADGGPTKGGWAVETDLKLMPGTVTVPAESLTSGLSTETSAEDLTTLSAILFALVGGLILNLMPCVFPVLSLKLLDLIEHRENRAQLAKHGFAFTGGVLASMLVISGLLLALRSAGVALGWGFQLQNPLVVALLLILFITLTLNLVGTFEFTLGTGLANKGADAAPKQGLSGSFFTGILAVIVASPCTAPFMGAALGFALTQSAASALLVFMSLGLGMALPWLLLCLFPAWAGLLPKPGLWMVRLRQVMAVPMGLAVLWLGWVLTKQVNTAGIWIILSASAACAVFLWLLGRAQWGLGSNRVLMGLMLAILVASLGLISSGLFARSGSVMAEKGEWLTWSPDAVETTLAAGQPAFVDFTAAWCITCQANKVSTLNRESVHEAFKRHGVKLFVADWTNQDPTITETLNRFARSGVPLYLLYKPDGNVEVLPQLLTPDAVIDVVDKLP